MNGGCHAVGPRPLAPRHERFGVFFYADPDLEFEPMYLAVYSQSWGSYISDSGSVWPVEYGADIILVQPASEAEPWVKDLHQKTADMGGAWNAHLEQYLPAEGEWYGRVFEPLKKIVDRAMEAHWNPTHPIEWERANLT